MLRHKWKDNVCIHCGLARMRKSWKLLMAIDERGVDHYKYGTGWYGWPHPEMDMLVKAVGFTRPECKKPE